MNRLLVIEDGNEYSEFARLFLAAYFHIVVAQRAADALACLRAQPVDVFRTDLRIVLKNVVRNAIQAVASAPAPRRLALDVQVEPEPTGEEFVVFRIRDSSPGGLDAGAGKGNDVEHGLGIVNTALRRYDGSLQVVPASDGYAKAVLVRFFHSQRSPAKESAA